MSDNKILDAVRKLDVGNDNHWTADGQARIDTVKMLAADQSIDRAAIEAAAPGFKRDTAATYTTETDMQHANGVDSAPAQNVNGDTVPPAPPLPSAPAADGLPTAGEPAMVEGGTPPGQTVADTTPAVSAGAESGKPPEIAQGTTESGTNQFNSDADDERDAQASTATSPNAPPAIGGSTDDVPKGVTNESASATEQREGETQLSAVDNGAVGDPDEVEALEAELEEVCKDSAGMKAEYDRLGGMLAASVSRESAIRVLIEKARPRGGTMPAIQDYFAAQDSTASAEAEARKAITDSGLDYGKIKALFEKTAPKS
jgi:hypothetical protein